uniref:Uncharacterized protein n=1 Tax=Globisporangium ultimum (strain ATCC 200006 / CBS 805.95 / DAOM BR144) TaxID=431595 RepID=K3WNG1_GLOUD
MSGLGSEARFCFDMVFSIRYVVCRAKFYLKIGNYKEAFAWLSLAHIKSDKDNLRKQAQLHFLDGKALFGLFQEYHESRRSYSSASSKVDTATIAAEVERMVHSFAGSLYGLNTQEKETLKTRMAQFCECAKSVEKCVESGVKSFWKAFDQYQSIDDVLHQLKSLLEIINFSLAPIERSFFALGSNLDDDVLKSHLQRGSASGKRSGSSHFGLDESLAAIAADDDIIERTRRSVLDAQKLLRRAMNLAEQVADPACLLRTLIFCSEAWVWLERIASYKNDKMVKEAAAFWEEGVKILNAVFLRRVAFHNCPQDAMQQHYSSRFHGAFPSGHARSTGNGTFSVVPILNFSEGFILKLEHMTLQLIFIACQLQLFERVPEYVEEMLALHLDELLTTLRVSRPSTFHQTGSTKLSGNSRKCTNDLNAAKLG